jgi:hypothetical protein
MGGQTFNLNSSQIERSPKIPGKKIKKAKKQYGRYFTEISRFFTKISRFFG